jgi:hypothetical protein
LLFLLLAGQSLVHASFKSGYAYNQCTVTVQSIVKELPDGYNVEDYLLITYSYSCPDNAVYTFVGAHSRPYVSDDNPFS